MRAQLRVDEIADHGELTPAHAEREQTPGGRRVRGLELPASASPELDGYLAQAPSLKRLYMCDLSEDDEVAERAARAGVALNSYVDPTPWSD